MRAGVTCFAAALLAACGGDRGAPFVARDSAGVRIVEFDGAGLASLPMLGVHGSPTTEIGAVDGPGALFQVAGAGQLSDGTIVLANNGSFELRWYGADGRMLRSTGRQGDGPGEFRSVELVAVLTGDSILAWDWQQNRVSLFSADGTFARSWTVVGDVGVAPDAVGALGADALVLVQRAFTRSDVRTGAGRDSVPVVVARADGSVQRIGGFGGIEVYREVTERQSSVSLLPFGRSVYVTVHGDRVWIGPNDDLFELRAYDGSSAALHVRIRGNAERRRVTDADRAANRRQWLDQTRAGAEAEIERLLAAMPIPSLMPAHGPIVAASDGRVWVQAPVSPADTARTWTVFDATGMPIARAATPANLDVLAIGADWLLGRARDELGVERVRLFQYREPPRR